MGTRSVVARRAAGLVVLLAALAVWAGCGGGSGTTMAPPGCSARVAAGSRRSPLTQHQLGGAPFGVAAGSAGRVFVAVNSPVPSGSPSVVVLAAGARGATVVATVPVSVAAAGSLLGQATVTHDGRYLLVADGHGVVVADTARLAGGGTNPIVGVLAHTGEAGTIGVAVSPDDRLVATSEEQAGAVTLFDLRAAFTHGLRDSGYLATIPVDPVPVGVAFTPDGHWLLATSETTAAGRSLQGPGTLSVIDVAAATRGDNYRPKSVVVAGCSPVRVTVAPNGATAWVTARASNALLAFDIRRLAADPGHSLLGWVRVGPAPVGVALTPDSQVAVVADSNRFAGPSRPSTVTLVDTAAVLAHRAAITATIPVGGFPREVTVTPEGHTAAITDFGTDEITFVATN